MADTWDLLDRVRPRARTEDVAQARPIARPDGEARPAGPRATRPRARPGELGEAPPEVRKAATVVDALPLQGAALLGVFLSPSGNRALVRLPGGGIVKVAEGETVGGGRVASIEADLLRLERNGTEVVLTMPG